VEEVELLRPLDNEYVQTGMREVFLISILKCIEEFRNGQLFAPYVTLVQSSGFGKTKLLYELADSDVVVVYFNCRTVAGRAESAIMARFKDIVRRCSLSTNGPEDFQKCVSKKLASILLKCLSHIGYSLGGANHIDSVDQFRAYMKRSFDPTSQEAFWAEVQQVRPVAETVLKDILASKIIIFAFDKAILNSIGVNLDELIPLNGGQPS